MAPNAYLALAKEMLGLYSEFGQAQSGFAVSFSVKPRETTESRTSTNCGLMVVGSQN
jgi:hypothetical protein